MLSAKQPAKQESSAHSLATDFCRVFEKDMNRLYLLSFLLTADHQLATDCFVRGLEDAMKSNGVFKEWAEAWARRMIIQNAIQVSQPRATGGAGSDHDEVGGNSGPLEVAAMVALPAFERFVFVMSVLERYSDQECSVLLDRSRSEVKAARIRALQQIGSAAELLRKGTGAGEDVRREGPGSAFREEALSSVGASA